MVRLDQLSRRYGKTPSEYLHMHWRDHDFDDAVAHLVGWYESEVEHFGESKDMKEKCEKRERHAQRVLHRLEQAARKAFGEEVEEEKIYAGLPGLLAAGVVQIED